MGTTVCKASAVDIPSIVDICAAAYANDRLHKHGLPGPMTDEQAREYRQYQLDATREQFHNPNRHYFKVLEDSSGRMVGFSCWFAPERKDSETSPPPTISASLPSFINKEKVEIIGRRIHQAKSQILGQRKNYWFLHSMCILPQYQGRGIGDQLLKQGLRDLVDRDGLDCYLEASEAAVKLYERNGFRPEIETAIDVRGQEYTVMTMLRKSPLELGQSHDTYGRS